MYGRSIIPPMPLTMMVNSGRRAAGRTAVGCLVALLGLAGCVSVPLSSLTPAPTPDPTATPLVPRPATETAVIPPSATPRILIPTWTPTAIPEVPTLTPVPPLTLAVEPVTLPILADAFRQLIDSRPAEFAWAEVGAADVTAGFDPTLPLGHWVFAAVAPFYTIPDEVEYADIVSAWNGAAKGPFAGRPFLFGQETADALESQFGHRPIGAQLVDSAELLDAAWAARPAWAIVPFEALEPRWKVLRVDGLSPLDKRLDPAVYPLALPVGLCGRADKVEEVWIALGGPAASVTNRDESLMTVLAMTGVTALARATAYAMEISGITYPGEEVARVLQSADIVHVSNEVSFASDCPYPDPARQEGPIRFCSDDRYIELLEFIGANVIELTGNHNNDWGTAAFDHTLAMYQQRGWGTFGGGANALEASQPLTVTHNGNTIGLMGCNPVGPRFAWATVDSPGAAYCTMQSLAASVTELAAQVDVVAVGIQYREHYTYAATSQQRTDFLALSAAGADIVSGSQGHHAQGFAFPAAGGSIVHFGLGNLFFDQMDKLGTRQTFIDRHVIYAGRLIATDLWTGLIENWARPRAMTPIERADLLRSVFAASDW